jgi:hypothetical protein
MAKAIWGRESKTMRILRQAESGKGTTMHGAAGQDDLRSPMVYI